MFGWVFASHQLGAAAAALGAGIIRDTFGAYTYAWLAGAGLCAVAAVLSISLRRRPDPQAPDSGRDPETESETASELTP